MNIMIIYAKPDVDKKPRFGFSYEMLSIATILNEKFRLYIKDYSCEHFDEKELCSELIDNGINIVLVECDSFALKRSENKKNVQTIISAIKELDVEVKVIAYGNQCYIMKQDIEGTDRTIKNSNINNLISTVYNFAGCVLKEDYRNYDSLPIVNRKLLKDIEYYNNNKTSTLVQTSKGCENTCIFCQRKGWQKKYEVHSDEYVVNEFIKLKEDGYKNIWIIDENFTFNLVRAKRILKTLIEYRLTNDMNLFISSWANIDHEFLDLASACNVKVISFGIESGNKEILQFYKKNIDLDRALEMIKYANSIGIFTVGNFIIGAPMESEDDIHQTFKFINMCKFDQVNIKTLNYMVGSELYDGMEKALKSYSHVFACKENGLNQFPLQRLIDLKKNFVMNYYKEHRNILKNKIIKYGTPYC